MSLKTGSVQWGSADMADDVLNELMDDADGDLVYAFRSAVVEGFISKPKLYINEDNYCNSDNFNEILSDRLGEL
jgi:hypothetical protein